MLQWHKMQCRSLGNINKNKYIIYLILRSKCMQGSVCIKYFGAFILITNFLPFVCYALLVMTNILISQMAALLTPFYNQKRSSNNQCN